MILSGILKNNATVKAAESWRIKSSMKSYLQNKLKLKFKSYWRLWPGFKKQDIVYNQAVEQASEKLNGILKDKYDNGRFYTQWLIRSRCWSIRIKH
jgi:hypothetical protein